VTYPAPLPGLVIRFSFLWSREARARATEGRKDRPCAIVVAVPRDEAGDLRVAVVPVTHSAPDDPAASIELPQAVKAALGLDPEPSWVRLDELGSRVWTAPWMQEVSEGIRRRCDCGRVSGLLARHIAAGPDGFRARSPNDIAALAGRVTPLGVPDVGSTDHHLLSLPSCTWHRRAG
jgi:hypothetical protein